MTLRVFAEAILIGWLAAAIIYQIAAQLSLRRFLSQRAAPPAGPLPAATILVPLGGGVPHLEEILGRLCATGAQVVAGVEQESLDALAAARRVRGRTSLLTIVDESRPAGSNRKIARLIRMLPEARGEILIFVDGDIGVPEGYLEAVLAPFADPAVGMVTCPYRSVAGATAASCVDAVMTNAGFLPSVALAARVEGVRFALGATMAIRRQVLEQIGGLEPLRELLADDWSMADRALQAGHRIVLAPILLDHCVGEPSWSAMWRRHLRWARTMRSVRPSGYAGTIVAHGCAPALALALPAGAGMAAGALAAWMVVRAGTLLLNARRTGSGVLDLLLLPAADAIALAAFIGGHCGRTVHWGGARLRVGRGGAILATDARDQRTPQADFGA